MGNSEFMSPIKWGVNSPVEWGIRVPYKMGDMAKYSKSKTKNGKKEIDTFSNLIYNEHYVQVYQNTFDLMYDDLKNCKMRLFWFLIDRLSQSNYFYIGKKLRGEFSSECEKRGNSYNDIKVTAALTELKREGKL